MKSILENSEIDFRIALDSYEHIRGFNDTQLAEELGCSVQTVRALRKNPLSGSGRYILPLLQRLKIAERRRYV